MPLSTISSHTCWQISALFSVKFCQNLFTVNRLLRKGWKCFGQCESHWPGHHLYLWSEKHKYLYSMLGNCILSSYVQMPSVLQRRPKCPSQSEVKVAIFVEGLVLKEKKEEIWLSPVTKTPTPTEQSKKQRYNIKTPPKTLITQLLQTNLGRSVGVTAVTQLVWLNQFTSAQPSH